MEIKKFEEISPLELENAIKMIGKDWMLITTQDAENGAVNAMTASWGCMGVLWNKNICACFIRPQRYTFGLAEREERLSLAFLGEAYRNALRICGSKSGRDCDKLKEAGLTAEFVSGVPVIQESEIVLICRKLYADDLKKDCFLDESLLSNYESNDFHRMYVCEIERAYRRIK